ncbi:MAG: HAD family hydrolase [Candidatus Levybacteria bacterium]|nr:HAD family hydrolase [Candidatus Levybacteria bacterium]
MKNILIFDWSGVISDDRQPVYEANMLLLEKYGKKRVSFEDWLINTRQSVVELLGSYGVKTKPEKALSEYKETFDRVRKSDIHPTIYPDARKVIRKLSHNGSKLFVISVHPAQNLEEEAKEYEVYHFFDEFIGSVRDKVTGIQNVLENFKANSDTYYIGDTIYDIQVARQAGIKSVAVTNGYHVKERLKKENPDIIVESLTELLKYF